MEVRRIYLGTTDEAMQKKQVQCSHTRLRTVWSASHLSQLVFGGYYQVGVFDTTIICTDCGLEWLIANKSLPLCQKCLTPMSEVRVDFETATFELARFKVKQKRDWQKYCARMERIEGELQRRRPPLKPAASFYDSLHRGREDTQDSMVRILQGSSRQQVWPYRCSNAACSKCGTLKFLHTPGD